MLIIAAPAAAQDKRIAIDGSSTVFPAMEAIAEEFQKANKGVKVTVGISVADLKKMWEPGAQGKVTRWKDVNEAWPDQPLKLYGAGADSGTFDYFTEATVGKAKSSRGDYTASEDDNVLIQGIEGNKYALGYIPYAYYAPHSNRMKAVSVEWEKNKVQEPVLPSPENVLA